MPHTSHDAFSDTPLTVTLPDDDDLLRLPEVRQQTGLSTATIYRLMGAGQFPQSLRLTQRLVSWRQGEIRLWKQSRPRTERVSKRV